MGHQNEGLTAIAVSLFGAIRMLIVAKLVTVKDC
jgi:hypothetical protein